MPFCLAALVPCFVPCAPTSARFQCGGGDGPRSRSGGERSRLTSSPPTSPGGGACSAILPLLPNYTPLSDYCCFKLGGAHMHHIYIELRIHGGQRRVRACAGSAQPARLWQPDGGVDAQRARLWHRWCRRAPASAIRMPRLAELLDRGLFEAAWVVGTWEIGASVAAAPA